jgi:hypothetical protein
MQPADAGGTGLRPRFPALDPEPPRRSWRRAALVLAAVVVVVAGLSGYAALRPGHHGGSAGQRTRTSPFSGLILAQASSGVLSLTDVHTGRVMLMRKLGEFSANPPPLVSPDGKYLVSAAMGTLFSLATPTQLAMVPNALTFPSTSFSDVSTTDPFSDHDASMLIQTTQIGYVTAFSGYEVQSVQSGHTASLGIADSAAGDPQAPGAFVSYAHPSRVTPPDGVHPDIGVELRDAGAAPKVLVTSARIDHVLGITPRYGVTLVPYPNPQGTMVAVAVQAISSDVPGGVVVYSRAGKLLGFQMVGPSGVRGLAWSRPGTMLAFAGQGNNGAELTQWEVGSQSTTSEMPVSLRQIDECAWSPDELSVLCGGGAAGAWWIVQSGVTYTFTGQGMVLAWLGGRLSR